MPNIKSQEKRVRTSAKRAMAVKSGKTLVKNAVKSVRAAVEANNAEAAANALKNAYAELDASVSSGVHHKNYADRVKSRLSKAVNSLKAA